MGRANGPFSFNVCDTQANLSVIVVRQRRRQRRRKL